MKHNLKKILLICLTASLAMTAFGCNKNNPETGETSTSSEAGNMPQETISLGQTKQPLTFVHDVDDGVDNTEGNAEEQEKTATTVAGGENKVETTTNVAVVEATEVVAVTDDKGQTATDAKGNQQTEVVKATQAVAVTDAAGKPETNAKGETQTEVVPVTETVVVTEKAENPATLSPNADPNNQQTSYSPVYDTCKAYWLDMSQESDFMFEGEFLIFEFEINKDIPDGSYPITISKTDIASWDLVSLNPKIINGEVAVNTEPQKQEDFPENDFALKVNSVSAKQGDTVKVAIDLKNNTGFCGFVIDVQYDKAAMTIVDTYGGENFTQSAINYVAD